MSPVFDSGRFKSHDFSHSLGVRFSIFSSTVLSRSDVIFIHCIRYRIWRTHYDAVCVQKYSKKAFRDLWSSDNEKGGKMQLNLVESEFRSSSGSIYDFMVARAQVHASYLFQQQQPLQSHAEQHQQPQTITPFELALVILYVHWVDKKEQKKSINIVDDNLSGSKQRFIAALEVVETMLERDDERARRASKDQSAADQTPADEHDNISKIKRTCRSAQNFHYKFHSGSANNGFIRCAFFCALIIFCAVWMATGPSAETTLWQSSVSSMAQAELASSYPDLTSFLTALAVFSAAWPPDDSFTRSLGNTELRVIRFDPTRSSSCSGAENLTCVPTIKLYPTFSIIPGMLPPSAFSDAPPSFRVLPLSKSFKFHRNETPFRCGSVYCFDGSGYSFQAADSSEYLAAVKSDIFDSSVRAVVVSFALYSPSLQAALKCSYLAELLPTGNVLVSFDSFMFDYVEAVIFDRTVQNFSKLLWSAKILVMAFF